MVKVGDFMHFIDDYRDIQNKTKQGKQADLIFEEILTRCGIAGLTPQEQYDKLYDMLAANNDIHNEIIDAGLKQDVSVVGSVTEAICEIGIRAGVPENRFGRLPRQWKWLGDFAIFGSPFNTFISVKSYKAKERLIASGTGQLAAPIIGYGLFDDPKEWNPSRVDQYRHRNFIAIYLPRDLYDILASKTGVGQPVTDKKNFYGKPILRKIEDLPEDLKRVTSEPDNLLDLELL